MTRSGGYSSGREIYTMDRRSSGIELDDWKRVTSGIELYTESYLQWKTLDLRQKTRYHLRPWMMASGLHRYVETVHHQTKKILTSVLLFVVLVVP